jgi:hypothetical protein
VLLRELGAKAKQIRLACGYISVSRVMLSSSENARYHMSLPHMVPSIHRPFPSHHSGGPALALRTPSLISLTERENHLDRSLSCLPTFALRFG